MKTNVEIILLIFLLYSFTLKSNNNSVNNKSAKIVGEELCVENTGHDRKTIFLWYKGEAISKISVASKQTICFEIGDYENTWDWKASDGIKGRKKSFSIYPTEFY